MNSEVTKEQIDAFLKGSNPQERIIKVECANNSSDVSVIYVDENGVKKIQKDSLYPFCWAKQSACREMFHGNRNELSKEMSMRGIACKGLRTKDADGNEPERMKNGYRVKFYATRPMSYSDFLNFFKKAGTPIYSNNDDENDEKKFMIVAPVEQYLMATGKRFFKGYDNYDDLLRCQWDLETEGLDPNINAISQIGIRTNRGFEKIITIEGDTKEEKFKNELLGIIEAFNTFRMLKPDIISGHNTENFDWNFIDVRLRIHGFEMKEVSKKFFPNGVYKKDKDAVLKLGGEMEYYKPTVMWGFNLTDSLFAVRRAQALDSAMKKSNLKYVTKYSKINKPNRVYVDGKIIDKTWLDKNPNYAFNNENGHWFKIDEKLLSQTFSDTDGKTTERYERTDNGIINKETEERFEIVTGRYIVQRYLLDDLWETDKIECRYNESNFLVGKMLPVSFERMCTMGTAAIWKYIMMAWSFEHDLAIPELIPSRRFVGGISRLLSVGYNPDVVKLDYNSLYPSIILTYGICSPIDIMGAMSTMLEYILTQREHYKELKAEWGAKANELSKYLKLHINEIVGEALVQLQAQIDNASMLKSRNDKLQLPLKITGNGFFGSYGSGSVFPWSDIECAEETTCCGRQALRLMIGHFSNIGNCLSEEKNIGEVTEDTMLFIRYDSGVEDVRSVADIINDEKRDYAIKTSEGWIKDGVIIAA